MRESIVLGTRGSDLALTQSHMVEDALRSHWPGLEIGTRIVRTSGDETVGRSDTKIATRAGRKGLFTAEIERALLAGTIDIAVHSAKDLPSILGSGTEIAAVLPRASVEDVLVSTNRYDLQSLPANAAVATGSVRRRHQLRWIRSDLQIVDLHGNVPTRLRKLGRQQWDAAVLARSGLERLGLEVRDKPMEFEHFQFSLSVLSANTFVPAGGQGIIAMQIRSEDDRTRKLLDPISDFDTRWCLRAEREFLRLLHGDCNQPVGVFAIVTGRVMKLRGQIFRPEALSPQEAVVEGKTENAERLAGELLHDLNGQ